VNNLDVHLIKLKTMFINSIRCSMGLSKHQERGMNALEIFLLKIVL
jgi:hypothetical protein